LQQLSFRTGTSALDDRVFDQANDQITHLARELIETHPPEHDDLMGEVLRAQRMSDGKITIDQIIQEVRTLILAGHVTTANVIACAFWLLSRDSALEAKLHDEIGSVIGERKVTLDDLPSLKFAEMVLLETLRLYPPVWVLGREALMEVRLGGFSLPANAKLVVCPWLLHRDPKTFPEPHRFYPERWRDDLRSCLPRGAFIPFSIGPRSCIGERFAMMEGMLILASVAQRWKFAELPDKPDPGWTPQVIYWPKRGIRLAAKLRAEAGQKS
jgi:cytochrome P450